jgi:transcriptional regulator
MATRTTRNRELLRGTLEVLILKALSRGRQHGFGVARWIEELTGQELRIEEGSLYPALHRLRARGLIEASWDVSEFNRRARYYRLTDAGRRRLRQETDGWRRYARAVSRVLRAT